MWRATPSALDDVEMELRVMSLRSDRLILTKDIRGSPCNLRPAKSVRLLRMLLNPFLTEIAISKAVSHIEKQYT